MRRFLVDPLSIADNLATLSENESRHITSVLRLEPGVTVELFDGSGVIYLGLLESVSKRAVTVRILSRQDVTERSPQLLVLCQCLLKPKKMDFLVQKATEMGVQTFQPLLSRYSKTHAPSPRQFERWNRIMLEACKQSRRATPMIIHPPAEPEDMDVSKFGTKILFWEGEKKVSLDASLLSLPGSICLVFGPEGGFRGEEIEQYTASGFHTVSLGSHILRAETAALAGTAIVRFPTGAFHAPDTREKN